MVHCLYAYIPVNAFSKLSIMAMPFNTPGRQINSPLHKSKMISWGFLSWGAVHPRRPDLCKTATGSFIPGAGLHLIRAPHLGQFLFRHEVRGNGSSSAYGRHHPKPDRLRGAAALYLASRRKSRLPLPWGKLTLMGLSGTTLYYLCFNTGMHYVTASTGALIEGLVPVAIAVPAALILKEHLNGRLVAGIVLSVTGVILVGFIGNRGNRPTRPSAARSSWRPSAFGAFTHCCRAR